MLMRRFGLATPGLVLLFGLVAPGCNSEPPPPPPTESATPADPNAVPPGMEPADPNLKSKKVK